MCGNWRSSTALPKYCWKKGKVTKRGRFAPSANTLGADSYIWSIPHGCMSAFHRILSRLSLEFSPLYFHPFLCLTGTHVCLIYFIRIYSSLPTLRFGSQNGKMTVQFGHNYHSCHDNCKRCQFSGFWMRTFCTRRGAIMQAYAHN